MSSKPRVVVVSPSPIPSFARQDAELLASSFEVDGIAVNGFGLDLQFRASIGRADAILVWFVGRSALLPTLLARMKEVPVVAVIGGFEVAWIERLGYGIQPGSLKERVLRRILSASAAILSVSNFSREEALKRFPELESKSVLIPNAVDANRFSMPEHPVRCGVISVGVICRETISRKSLEIFRDVALRMHEEQFTLVGRVTDQAGRQFVDNLPANMKWEGPVSGERLVSLLQSASIYFQASIHEAFCVAMAEAMSCGCFPVISNCAALPEVAGPTATVLNDLTPESAEVAIRNALKRGESDRVATRNRIVEHYGIDRRRELLCSTVQKAIDQSTQ